MMKWNEWPKLFSVWYSQPTKTPREGAGGRQYWDNNSVGMFLSATWQWYVREKLFIKLLYRFWYKQQLLWFYKRTGVMSTLAHFLLSTTASLTRVRRLSVQQTIFIIWLIIPCRPKLKHFMIRLRVNVKLKNWQCGPFRCRD